MYALATWGRPDPECTLHLDAERNVCGPSHSVKLVLSPLATIMGRIRVCECTLETGCATFRVPPVEETSPASGRRGSGMVGVVSGSGGTMATRESEHDYLLKRFCFWFVNWFVFCVRDLRAGGLSFYSE